MNRRHLTVRVNLRGVDLSTFLRSADRLIDKEVKYDHGDVAPAVTAGRFEEPEPRLCPARFRRAAGPLHHAAAADRRYG
ncbi:MAG: hypothetical protein ACLTZY_00870 [Alistipes indistinctus]